MFHFVVAVTLLSAANCIQRAYGMDRFVQSSLQWLRHGWFAAVVGLLYALAWCTWYLMLTVRTRDDAESDADIPRQWKAAKRRMDRAGIDIRRAPLFLTLGQPAGGVHRFFTAGQLPFLLPATAADDDAALSVCGDRHGLFVCCNQTSLLGDFTARFAASAAVPPMAGAITHRSPLPERAAPPGDHGEVSLGRTTATHSPAAALPSTAGGATTATLTRIRPTVAAVPVSATVQAMEQRLADLEYQLALADATPEAEVSAAHEPASLLQDNLAIESSAAERLLERLEVICRLIAEDREPLCPVNGIVLLVPIQVLDCDATVDEVGNRIEQDLQAVIRTMEMEVSVQVVMCGLEGCEGADQWLARCPHQRRHRPLGTLLPDSPANESDAEATLTDKTADWLCHDLFPQLAHGLFRRGGGDSLADRNHQEGNRSLHRFVQGMRARRDRLSRMLHHSVARAPGRWRLRGCFFAATGRDAATGQGFVSGLMPLIQGMQHEVRWLESRCRRDTVHLAITIAGYFFMALAAIGTVAILALA